MSENLNATCSICGKKYHRCDSCKNTKSFKSWRVVTDTEECFKIYSALFGYTKTGDKNQAREELRRCDLSGLETFDPDVKRAIKEILKDEKEKINVSAVKISNKRTKKTVNEETTNDNIE